MPIPKIFFFPPKNTFLVGGASCERNIYWSQTVPGIHSCKTKNLTTIFRNYDERKQQITIGNSTSNEAHCIQEFDESEISQFIKLSKEKTYLTFYFNESKAKGELFKNESHIYTHFNILYDSNNDIISIESLNPVDYKANKTFGFYFTCNKTQKITTNTQKTKEISPYTELLLLGICFACFMICRTILKNQYVTVSTVEISERWRQPRFMAIELYIATYGVATLNILPLYWLMSQTTMKHFVKVILSGLLGFILPSIWRTIFGKMVNEEIDISAYTVPTLIYNIFFILPLTAANFFATVICGSLRGIAGTLNLFINMFLSTQIAMICVCSGKLGHALWDNQNDDNIMFNQSKSHHPKCFMEVLTTIIYVLVGSYMSRNLIDEAIKFFLLDMSIDTYRIVETISMFACFSFVLSCFRTMEIHKLNKFSWMSGFVIRNFILACVIGLKEVWRLFSTLLSNYFFEASVYYATGVMIVIGVMVGIGSGCSIIAAFLLTKSIFS